MRKLLEIKNLVKSFGGVRAIDHLSFDIYEGEILGLIGPNGSGKSTCVNLIAGTYIQDQGTIIFDDQSHLKRQSVPDRTYLGIARTFQSPRPFSNLTVWNSIFTAALLHNKNRANAMAETDRILEFTGFTDSADELCSKLPIEKRKWLDMARCLAIKPKLLMLDECLAGLTPTEMDESIKLIQKIAASGVTVLFIEHVMSAVTKLCHRVVVLGEGALLCQGEPNSVMCEEVVIKAYLGEEYVNAGN